MGSFQDEADEIIGKKWRIILTIVAALIVFYIIIALIGGIWPFSAMRGIVKKTMSAEAIVGNYEWFYNMKAEIDATRMKYQIAEKSKLSEADGILMVLNSMIAEYNSRSKQKTRTMWKASDLPYQIDMEGKE